MAHAAQQLASIVVEKEDGKSVVLRRSVEHPGSPMDVSSAKPFTVEAKKPSVSPGSIRFFADVAKMSSKLRHS